MPVDRPCLCQKGKRSSPPPKQKQLLLRMGDNIQSKVAVKSMNVSSSVTPAPPENVGGLQELANGNGMPSQSQLPAGGSPTKPSSASSANNNVVGVHYKIGRKIGEGSFGIIYEGNHPWNEGRCLPSLTTFTLFALFQVSIYSITSQ
jgi:hypothetical protein